MNRREVLQYAASSAALALLPSDCHLPWSRVGKTLVGPTLTEPQRASVRALAGALLPRTATPGALDVGVPAFVDVIVAEQYGNDERQSLADGLAHLDSVASREGGSFATRTGVALTRTMRALEAPKAADTDGQRGYAQLRWLIIHGYFTSEPVQREVLHTEIMPGHFDGAMPFHAPTASVTND